MKRRLRFFSLLLAVCLCFGALTAFLASCSGTPRATLHEPGDNGYIPTSANLLDFSIDAGQAFVYDMDAGEYLYLKGEARVLYPASTTKLLTILYVLTLLSPDTLVTAGEEVGMIAHGSSIAYIKRGHTLTVEMLIEGVLLPSGNDAAYVLAAAGGRTLLGNPDAGAKEAVDVFVDGMNRYGEEIGLCGSRFLSPDGNTEEAHYSTVEDMTIIARLAAENADIMRYAGLSEDDVTYASGETNHWVNTNLMLDPDSEFYDSAVTGLKTGSLGKGKYSVIVTAELAGKRYLIGVFAAKTRSERFQDARRILEGLRESVSVSSGSGNSGLH